MESEVEDRTGDGGEGTPVEEFSVDCSPNGDRLWFFRGFSTVDSKRCCGLAPVPISWTLIR